MITLRTRVQNALISAAFASATIVALGVVVACEPEAPDNQPRPIQVSPHSPAQVEPWQCQVARQFPAYSYTYQGSRVDVPSGKVLVEEIESDPNADAEAGCTALVEEYNRNR